MFDKRKLIKDHTVGETYITDGEGTRHAIPVIDILAKETAEEWNRKCLKDRLEHPEKYAAIENVNETIARIKKRLGEGAERGVTLKC